MAKLPDDFFVFSFKWSEPLFRVGWSYALLGLTALNTVLLIYLTCR